MYYLIKQISNTVEMGYKGPLLRGTPFWILQILYGQQEIWKWNQSLDFSIHTQMPHLSNCQ